MEMEDAELRAFLQRLEAAEWKARSIDRDKADLVAQVTRIGQWGQQSASLARRGTVTCPVQVLGQATGCDSRHPQGVTVTFTGSPSGILCGSFTTDAGGNYSGTIQMPLLDTALTVTWTHTRFATNMGTGGPIACGGGPYNFGASLTPAAGYGCFTGGAFPLKLPLSATDSFFGAFTFPSSGLFGQSNTKLWNYVGVGGCGSSANVPFTVNLLTYTTAEHEYPATGVCPNASSGTIVGDRVDFTLASSSGPPNFTATWNWNNPQLSGAAQTLTIQEAP